FVSQAVFALCFGRVGQGIVDVYYLVVLFQLRDDVDDASVSQIGAVFLEGQAQDQNFCAGAVAAFCSHQFDHFAGNELAHAVVGAPTREDHLRVEVDLLGLVGQVVGVDADAVSADQAGLEGQEVPFGGGGFEHRSRVQAQSGEQHGQFVDKGDIDVTLGVFDDLGGFGDLDRRGAVSAGRNDGSVEGVDEVGCFGRGGACDLDDVCHAVGLVAGVDALRRVAGEKSGSGIAIRARFGQSKCGLQGGSGLEDG